MTGHRWRAALLAISCLIILGCAGSVKMENKSNANGPGLPIYSDWDVKYPVDLSADQESVLTKYRAATSFMCVRPG
jgi:hypothetical protein